VTPGWCQSVRKRREGGQVDQDVFMLLPDIGNGNKWQTSRGACRRTRTDLETAEALVTILACGPGLPADGGRVKHMHQRTAQICESRYSRRHRRYVMGSDDGYMCPHGAVVACWDDFHGTHSGSRAVPHHQSRHGASGTRKFGGFEVSYL
jgi:hypothetical protein